MSIAQVLAEGRLIRQRWADTDAEGRQLLCLYTALAGDPEARPPDCPVGLAPRWVAHLLPWLDDAPSEEAWPEIVGRVAAIADRLHVLTQACEWRVRALCVRETMRHTSDAEVLAISERVAALCERRGAGEAVPDAELSAAAAAAGGAWCHGSATPRRRARAGAAARVAGEAVAAARVAGEAVAAAADRLALAILEEMARDLGAMTTQGEIRSTPCPTLHEAETLLRASVRSLLARGPAPSAARVRGAGQGSGRDPGVTTEGGVMHYLRALWRWIFADARSWEEDQWPRT